MDDNLERAIEEAVAMPGLVDPSDMPNTMPTQTGCQIAVEPMIGPAGIVNWVSLAFHTAQGLNKFYFEPDKIETIAKGILDTAAQARSGLIIAGEMPGS